MKRMVSTLLLGKPDASEYPAYADVYMRLVSDSVSVLKQLRGNCKATVALLASLPESALVHSYAPGKWTIKDTVCHVSDDERIFVYRALRFARCDGTALPGVDQDAFAHHARANEREITDLLQEFVSVREATLTFFESLEDASLRRSGVADGKRSTVRALAFHIAGHELHHLGIIRQHHLHLP